MEVGSKVEHIFTKDWMLVLEIVKKSDGSGNKVLCRTKDLREVWFHSFELVAL